MAVILIAPAGGWWCAFGPTPRDYRFKVNKKTVLSNKSALSLKAKNNAIVVVEDFVITPKPEHSGLTKI